MYRTSDSQYTSRHGEVNLTPFFRFCPCFLVFESIGTINLTLFSPMILTEDYLVQHRPRELPLTPFRYGLWNHFFRSKPLAISNRIPTKVTLIKEK